jgi:hypothetical protein
VDADDYYDCDTDDGEEEEEEGEGDGDGDEEYDGRDGGRSGSGKRAPKRSATPRKLASPAAAAAASRVVSQRIRASASTSAAVALQTTARDDDGGGSSSGAVRRSRFDLPRYLLQLIAQFLIEPRSLVALARSFRGAAAAIAALPPWTSLTLLGSEVLEGVAVPVHRAIPMLLRPMQCQLCGAAGADAPKLCRAFNVFAHESCVSRQVVCIRELDRTLVSAVLCCAVLCCAVLCCAVLCCAVLCCAVLCCAVLCCAVLC